MSVVRTLVEVKTVLDRLSSEGATGTVKVVLNEGGVMSMWFKRKEI